MQILKLELNRTSEQNKLNRTQTNGFQQILIACEKEWKKKKLYGKNDDEDREEMNWLFMLRWMSFCRSLMSFFYLCRKCRYDKWRQTPTKLSEREAKTDTKTWKMIEN